jgi:hypothetical protein
MPTRNTKVLVEILQVLNVPGDALQRLEEHFKHALLIVAGTTNTITVCAEQLRLRIAPSEQPEILDHIAETLNVGITVDHVENAINALFPDRFIEPR